MLIEDLKDRYRTQLSDAARLSILNALLRLKYRDIDILKFTCELIITNKITNISSITNILYILSKFQYRPSEGGHEDNLFMSKCA